MIPRLLVTVGMACALFGSVSTAAAHPDIAVSVRLTFAMESTRLIGFSQRLVFDAATSRRLLGRFDADHDGTLSSTEFDALAAEILPRLSERNAYTELTLDHRSLPVPDPAVSELRLHEGYLELGLDFRFAEAPDLHAATLGMLMRDRDLVIAFRPDPATLAIIAPDNKDGCVTGVEQRPDLAYFGGLVTPSVVTLSCK